MSARTTLQEGQKVSNENNGEYHRIDEMIGGTSQDVSSKRRNGAENKRGGSRRVLGRGQENGSRVTRGRNRTNAAHALHENAEISGRVKWVSGEDDGKIVARLIVGAGMASAVVGFPVTLHAKYETNINTTLKGVAIAGKRCLEELGIHIACVPHFRDNRNELTVTVVKIHANSAILASQFEESTAPGTKDVLTVARTTDYRILAGAVAKRARENQQSVLRAIGPAAVFAAARALATCREYLEHDVSTQKTNDVIALPRFSKVHVQGRETETTVLELCVFPANPTSPFFPTNPVEQQAASANSNDPDHTTNQNGMQHYQNENGADLDNGADIGQNDTENQIPNLTGLVNPPPGLGGRSPVISDGLSPNGGLNSQ